MNHVVDAHTAGDFPGVKGVKLEFVHFKAENQFRLKFYIWNGFAKTQKVLQDILPSNNAKASEEIV